MNRHQATTRHAVAVEAARLLYRREFKEYYQAKREAAKRQGVTVLPTNQEIHRQILLIAEATEGEERCKRLQAMRQVALQVMEALSEFSPRLIGSVLTGHIRAGSDIDLHLYGDSIQAVCTALEAAHLNYQTRVVRSRKQGRELEFQHLHHVHSSGFEVEMTLYPEEEYHNHPICSITGGPMARASLAEVRRLVGSGEQVTLPAGEPGPWVSLLRQPMDWARVEEVVPELAACRGVPQNHYHHLDVYEHTLAVVQALSHLLECGFQPFHFGQECAEHFSQTVHGWPRRQLLLWAGLCHDLGKPHTLTLHHSGRYRFFGHDSRGRDIVENLADRLQLPIPVSNALQQMVEQHMRAVLLPSQQAMPSEHHAFFRDAGDYAPELLLLSWADVLSSRGPASAQRRLDEQQMFVEEMLGEYFQRGMLRYPNCPVSSVDLKMELGVEDPRLLDRLGRRLTEEYLDGEFQGREDGLCRASELVELAWDL